MFQLVGLSDQVRYRNRFPDRPTPIPLNEAMWEQEKPRSQALETAEKVCTRSRGEGFLGRFSSEHRSRRSHKQLPSAFWASYNAFQRRIDAFWASFSHIIANSARTVPPEISTGFFCLSSFTIRFTFTTSAVSTPWISTFGNPR